MTNTMTTMSKSPSSQKNARRERLTAITGGTVIAFDGKEHRRIENGVVAYRGDTVVFVGRRLDEPADETLDARGKIVIPGLVSAHSHVGTQSAARLILDEGRPEFARALFLNFIPTRLGGPTYLDRPDPVESLRFGMASLIRHGITSVVPFSPGGPSGGTHVVELADEMGVRLFYSPVTTAGSYHFDERGTIRRVWDEDRGLRELDRAMALVSRYDRSSTHQGMVVVDEFEFATPLLLKRAREAAEALGVGITLHAAEQVYEFHDSLRRSGRTPIEVLADHGILGPKALIAHCIFVAGHSSLGHPHGDDIGLLADTGTSVAHCPVVQSRRGYGLESFQRYRDRGVNIALGADTWPLDLFAEMRMAAILGKLMDARFDVARSMDVFNAATLGGAHALGRDDIGRLSPGAKADIVLVDVDTLTVGPIRDPIQALVHLANASMVDTVIIAGRTLLQGKRFVDFDEREVLDTGRTSARADWKAFEANHWSGRPLDEVFPRAIKDWSEG